MLRFSRRFISKQLLPIILSVYSIQSLAYVILPNNRIIIEERQKTQAVELINTIKMPLLVQLSVKPFDNVQKQNQDAKNNGVPFFISPPVFVIPGDSRQRTRLTLTQQAHLLPKDRETAFWFDFMEITPKTAVQTPATLSFAINNRVKLFYRPAGIKANVSKLPELLTFTLKQSKGKQQIVIDNPTGYYADFGSTELKMNGQKVPLIKELGLILPFSSETFSVPADIKLQQNEVKFTLVNDYGGRREYTSTLLVE